MNKKQNKASEGSCVCGSLLFCRGGAGGVVSLQRAARVCRPYGNPSPLRPSFQKGTLEKKSQSSDTMQRKCAGHCVGAAALGGPIVVSPFAYLGRFRNAGGPGVPPLHCSTTGGRGIQKWFPVWSRGGPWASRRRDGFRAGEGTRSYGYLWRPVGNVGIGPVAK